jgi:hypothetical protein
VGLAISDPDIVRTALTAFWGLAEPVRLGAGYYGNLQENVCGPRGDAALPLVVVGGVG